MIDREGVPYNLEMKNIASRMYRVRRIFVSPGNQLFPAMVLEAGCACIWTLSLTTRNDTHAPIAHPFLGRFFCLHRCLLTLSRGLMIETFHVDSRCPACIFGGLLTIFVSASGLITPYDVTCRPSFDAI